MGQSPMIFFSWAWFILSLSLLASSFLILISGFLRVRSLRKKGISLLLLGFGIGALQVYVFPFFAYHLIICPE